jgi:hypothetical protein
MALCILAMPQSYRGGASHAHPHAVFQFWTDLGPATAEHHHDGEDTPHRHEPEPEPAPSPSVRTSSPDVPTISEVVSAAERATALGGVVGPWLVLLTAVAAGALFWLWQSRSSRSLLPEIPPPRIPRSPVVSW